MNIEQFSAELINGTGETVKIVGFFGIAATAVLGLKELTTGAVDSFIGIANMTSSKAQSEESQESQPRTIQSVFSNVGKRLTDRGTTYGLIFLMVLGSVAFLKIGGGLQGQSVQNFFSSGKGE